MNANKGYLMIFGAGVCWGTTGIFSTVLFQAGIDPLYIASSRIMLTTLLLLLMIKIKFPASLVINKENLFF